MRSKNWRSFLPALALVAAAVACTKSMPIPSTSSSNSAHANSLHQAVDMTGPDLGVESISDLKNAKRQKIFGGEVLAPEAPAAPAISLSEVTEYVDDRELYDNKVAAAIAQYNHEKELYDDKIAAANSNNHSYDYQNGFLVPRKLRNDDGSSRDAVIDLSHGLGLDENSPKEVRLGEKIAAFLLTQPPQIWKAYAMAYLDFMSTLNDKQSPLWETYRANYYETFQLIDTQIEILATLNKGTLAKIKNSDVAREAAAMVLTQLPSTEPAVYFPNRPPRA